ncbi:MAG: RNA polymerase sigma factor SigJ [Pseudomonadota bacterium]
MLSQSDTQTFEDVRPRLLGLAYRILGSLTDAEDAVQETFLKWANVDREAIVSPPAWLTTACTRQCLDVLRGAHRSRVDYVGTWLPEPIQTAIQDASDADLDLATSLKTAFLLMLQRLTPRERAAYLLHEIFELPYRDVAATLDVSEPACRKLVSRAKDNIDSTRTRFRVPIQRQDELLAAFETAIKSGTTGHLTPLLADDIRLVADGGGKVPAILDTLRGVESVTEFLSVRLHDYWDDHAWNVVDMNGERGVVIRDGDEVVAAVTFAYADSGKVTHIYIVRNPDKLTKLKAQPLH